MRGVKGPKPWGRVLPGGWETTTAGVRRCCVVLRWLPRPWQGPWHRSCLWRLCSHSSCTCEYVQVPWALALTWLLLRAGSVWALRAPVCQTRTVCVIRVPRGLFGGLPAAGEKRGRDPRRRRPGRHSAIPCPLGVLSLPAPSQLSVRAPAQAPLPLGLSRAFSPLPPC